MRPGFRSLRTTAVAGQLAYSDSATAQYAIGDRGKSANLTLVLSSGQ